MQSTRDSTLDQRKQRLKMKGWKRDCMQIRSKRQQGWLYQHQTLIDSTKNWLRNKEHSLCLVLYI